MQRSCFEHLQTVRLEHESLNGWTELCYRFDGSRWLRLCITSFDCQREILNSIDKTIPTRIENDILELLLPWQEGISLPQWLFERSPTLGQRRDVCLSLLSQQVEMRRKLPPCLTALAASSDNLIIADSAAYLQYLPNFRYWQPGIGEEQAVCAVATVICEILTPKQSKWFHRQFPEELQLLYCRQENHDYTDWGQLQRDVAAIPDELSIRKPIRLSCIQRIQSWLSHYGKCILRILAALLLSAAVLSLMMAYRQRKSNGDTVWPGMPLVGDQDLRSEEGNE